MQGIVLHLLGLRDAARVSRARLQCSLVHLADDVACGGRGLAFYLLGCPPVVLLLASRPSALFESLGPGRFT